MDDAGFDDIDKRLARISGHAASLRKMWQEEADPDDILTQINAVRSALEQVGKKILQHHVTRHLEAAAQSGDATEAVRELTKALDRIF
ncbi:MAG: metal-sensitive transcriptional regulator [Candidatus Xenobia bacterium]